MTEWVSCDACGAMNRDLFGPPHGLGKPCPLRLEEHAARLRQLEARPVRVTLESGQVWQLPVGEEYRFNGVSFVRDVWPPQLVPE